jgi:hypothetical protein
MLALTAAGTGETVMWIGGVVAAAGVIAKSPPARWIWRRNVTEPALAALRRVVGEVVDEKLDARPLTNGWGAKAVGAIAETVGADVPPPKTDPPTEPDEGR